MKSKLLRAQTEWTRYAKKLTDAKPVVFDLNKDQSLGTDGYLLRSDEKETRIAAPTPRGLLYGAYALINACRQAGDRFVAMQGRELPHFPLRMLWSWSRLDRTYRHSPYMKLPSVLSRSALEDPEHDPEMMRFVRHMASMRVNALAITHELHHSDLEHADQHGFRPYYAALEHFALFLKEWGVDLYLYTATAPEKDFCKDVADTDCPYDPRVQEFWSDFTKEICTQVPDMAGLLLAGGLGGYANGRLNECECEYCAGKTLVEKAREQITMIADLLALHGKTLVYTVTTDIPFTLDREVCVIQELLDNLPDNATITFKNCFHDYEELRYPEHPVMKHLPKRTDLPIAVEMQLFPEMRGKGLILSNTTEVWCRQFSELHEMGARGVIGVIETHPDDAHPSMAEWYAWGRLAWYSQRRPRDLLAQWTRMEYPDGVDKILPDILLDSYMAASNTIYGGGMQCGLHGMLAPYPHYTKHKMNETWCRTDQPAPFGVLGVDDEPFNLYTPEMQNEITKNPRLFLLVKARKVTPELYTWLMAEKEAAILQYSSMLMQWRTVRTVFEPADYRYELFEDMLAKNVEDARRFKECFSLFLRWQMGVLKNEELLGVRERLLAPHVPCSINTCDALVERFTQHLYNMLNDIPFSLKFNNMSDLPQITSPCWQEGNVCKQEENQ